MQKNKIIFGIVLLAFVISAYFFNQMPEEVPSHWNSEGEVDGYLGRFWGTFLMPIVMFGIALLFIAIPYIDPLKRNIEKFRNYFDNFIIMLMVFFFVINLIIILNAIGIEINPSYVVPIMVGILFFYIGYIMPNFKRNWFMGIRTPWTLSSDKVWEKTHLLAGKLFRILGIFIVFTSLMKLKLVYVIVVPALIVVVVVVAYSYLEYKKEKK